MKLIKYLLFATTESPSIKENYKPMFWQRILRFACLVLVATVVEGQKIYDNLYPDKSSSTDKNELPKIPNQGYNKQNDIPAVTHKNKLMYQYLGNWIMNTSKKYLDFVGSDRNNPEQYNHDYRLDQRPSYGSSSELKKIDIPMKDQSIYKFLNKTHNKHYKKFNYGDADKEEHTKNNFSYNGTIQKLFWDKIELLKRANQGYNKQNGIPPVTHKNKQMYQYLANWIMNASKKYRDLVGSNRYNPEKYNHDYRLDQRPSYGSGSELKKIDIPVNKDANKEEHTKNNSQFSFRSRKKFMHEIILKETLNYIMKRLINEMAKERSVTGINHTRSTEEHTKNNSQFSFRSRKKFMHDIVLKETLNYIMKGLINEMAKERSVTGIKHTRSTSTEIPTTVTPLKRKRANFNEDLLNQPRK
ncbi:uncharacterized protein LOC143242891 [Tachypleus tridentatus]|uniref:uncharacterized protein LOC143242891 n=1 Tax=Tachypleus tridentatus TaxID=6853 RepID=UPI003FD5B4D4